MLVMLNNTILLTIIYLFVILKIMGLWLSWLERNLDMVKIRDSSPLSPTNLNSKYIYNINNLCINKVIKY